MSSSCSAKVDESSFYISPYQLNASSEDGGAGLAMMHFSRLSSKVSFFLFFKRPLRSKKKMVSYQTEGENINFLEGMLEISSSERFRI